MDVRGLITGIVVPALLAACAAPEPRSTPLATADVRAAVRAAIGDGIDGHFFDATVDLDGDGRDEVLAYAAGPMLCGTGGCPLLIFRPGDGRYELVTQVSVSRPPVRVAQRTTHGWRNLIVAVSGGGVLPGYDAELEFDGKSYPSNPTVTPARPAGNLAGSRILIPEFDSLDQGKPF